MKVLKSAGITIVSMLIFSLSLLAEENLVCNGDIEGNVEVKKKSSKPAILFSCPGENRYHYVGFDYMKSLVKSGFEVDYIESSRELTWEKVKNFNVLVVMDFPAEGPGERLCLFAMRPPWLKEYFGVVKRFLETGGGVFLHYNPHYGGTAPNNLLKQWGIQFPLIYINDQYVERITNLGHGNRCAFTDQILPSPVSEGVRHIWYPIDTHYTGAHTMPILVDRKWQVVVRPSKAAYTVVPKYDRGGIQPVPGALIPKEPIKDPVIFAIREFKGSGRLAAVQTWHQFSIGSGMKWLYNNEILSKGLAGRPSDYGKLLLNTYKWLAQPSLKSGTVGGHVTDMARLTEPQLRPGAMKQFAEWIYKEEEVLEYRRPPSRGKIFRGLIGAQTALSSGQGSVADWAKAATDLKLDFLVFIEDLAKLTPEGLETLKAEVKKNTTATLQLFAGYRMKANTGNYLFLFGENPVWPEARLLTGADKRTFNLQYQDEKGNWAKGNPALDWCISAGAHNNNTIGYFNFTKSGKGMKMYDLRVYSVAAIRTYEKGKLVEDMTDDYLTTCQSTAVPTPVSMNIVRSPEDMREAIAKNQALTYAQARTLKTVFKDALRWNCSYDGLNVFLSDGPIIRAWTKCARTLIFGAERFVTGRSLSPSPIHITSDVGLKEIKIYNGQDLFRRFILNGEKEFSTTLFLSGIVYRSMVLIAEDVKGGRAISFAYRSYKEGGYVPIFCSDHVNDCGHMLLAHGPHWPGIFPITPVPNAGFTWDGGPRATRPLCTGQFTYPAVYTSLGNIKDCPYQIPLLEFADEAAVRCRMVSNRALLKDVPRGNPWSAFGPLEPSELYDVWASHAYYCPYNTGVAPNAYGAPSVLEGPFANLFTEEFTFKKEMTLNRLRLFHAGWRKKLAEQSVLLLIGKGGSIQNVIDLTELPEKTQRNRIDTGGWFALYSGQTGNTQLFINRGAPFFLDANSVNSFWLQIWADIKDLAVKPGDKYRAEFFTMTWPLNQMLKDAKQIADTVAYLVEPTGMQLMRGKQGTKLGGLLELVPDNYAVELSIPKPEDLQITLPVRVSGFNKRWTVGLYQIKGHRTHYYSKGDSGWRELGLDFAGRAYVPLYVSMRPETHVMIGHPVTADKAGKHLFIQATRINDGNKDKEPQWHISVNNPGDVPVTATLRRAMDLPGLFFRETTVRLRPGEYKVLVNARQTEGDTEKRQ